MARVSSDSKYIYVICRGLKQPVEGLELLAYIAQTRNNVSHAGNGREYNLPGVPNV